MPVTKSETVTLGGESWEIPTLGPKQSRVVVPALSRAHPKILEARRLALADPSDETKGVIPNKWIVALIENGGYDELCTLTWAALTRAKPDLTKEQFENLPVDAFEMLTAFPVIARQAGLMLGVPAQGV